MTKLNPISAAEDLLWLQNRFRSLLELVPKLQAISSLESYEAELQASVASGKANLEELSKLLAASKEVLDRESKKAETVVKDAQDEAAALIHEAKMQAEELRVQAKDDLSKEITNLAAQKQKKVKEVDDLSRKFDELSAQIAEQEKTFNDLTNAIAELKARF